MKTSTATAKTPKTPFAAAVGRALRRSAKVARKTARMHNMPIYISKNGKVVAVQP